MIKIFFWFYRMLISPVLHLFGGANAGCRFHPTCSQYAEEAVRVHGVFWGGIYAIKRIARCHPWGGSGEDPIPPRKRS